MPVPLRVLLVEAHPGDLSRGVDVLRRGGFEVESRGGKSAEALREALPLGPWDVLLCAEDVPGLAPGAAVEVLRAGGVDLPLLVLSARHDERVAGEVMRAGARDFFPSGALERLPAAVAREVEQARLRREYTRVVGERSLLARAGEALARSLDFQETLDQVVRLVVPELADWCLVYCPDEHGGLKLMALAHEDPERVARGFQLDRLFPLLPEATRGPMAVWRTGEAQLIPDVDPSWLEVLSRSPEHLRVMLGMGLRSVIHVPLLGRLGAQGVMSLCITGSRERFTPADLALCQDVARPAPPGPANAPPSSPRPGGPPHAAHHAGAAIELARAALARRGLAGVGRAVGAEPAPGAAVGHVGGDVAGRVAAVHGRVAVVARVGGPGRAGGRGVRALRGGGPGGGVRVAAGAGARAGGLLGPAAGGAGGVELHRQRPQVRPTPTGGRVGTGRGRTGARGSGGPGHRHSGRAVGAHLRALRPGGVLALVWGPGPGAVPGAPGRRGPRRPGVGRAARGRRRAFHPGAASGGSRTRGRRRTQLTHVPSVR